MDIKSIIEKFKPNDLIDTYGDNDFMGIGKIIDVFKSEYSDNYIILILFMRNVLRQGNSGGDMLVVSEKRTMGIEKWKKITRQAYNQHVINFSNHINQEIQKL